MLETTYARLQTRTGESPRLLGITLSGDLHGLLFEASVVQRFCNASDTNMEVSYTFPLPWGACLMDVEVVLSDKKLSGCVVEKMQAEEQYEEALSEGNAAIMLEKNHDRSYTLNLGNLAAGEECCITLRYAQTLQFEQGGLRLMIPTVIAPCHGNPLLDAGLQPHQAPDYSLEAEYLFDLQLRLHGALTRARVASPSHPVAVTLAQGESPTTQITPARKASLDRDFVLVLDQLPQTSLAIAAPDYADLGKVAVLASFCPTIDQKEASPAAVKILVDCSGSMGGDSITAAKRALHGVLAQLDNGERFSLSRFGSAVEHRSRGLWKASSASRKSAAQWVDALQADMGGTNMEEALCSTFARGNTLGGNEGGDLLLITDGEIHAIDSVIEASRASDHRLFIVGIGSSPAESHLRRLALATGGACDFVAPGEDVDRPTMPSGRVI